ncbi:MAG TPA: alpha-L-arabinofuranosidase C-terminal domain-containing protein [Armatimonadota bacterium]|nr:alpha-L-arabinofuranosidase C-terminal domain-containing protein [Armatimonadota bacterium]
MTAAGSTVSISPNPKFELSPYLFMQFMEPLGTTDSSVEAGWDFVNNRWREDLIEATIELAPTLIRWGGCLTSYYRWKEGIGPRTKRKPMVNLCWGGVETNQIGTHEFLDFCKRVGADPLIGVNFESDGRKPWARPACGGLRSAGPKEAAEWVDYCNNPSNKLRQENGQKEPFNVRLWQIGNETSYDPDGYNADQTARRTLAFAKAMHAVDPDIKLIGWGDGKGWTAKVMDAAGDHLEHIAFHCHYGAPEFISQNGHLQDPAKAWEMLMDTVHNVEEQVQRMREETKDYPVTVAITEGHYTLRARNRGDVLSTWATGVSYARIMQAYERNGDLIKIATLADFCGNRWQVNALMIPTPVGKTYLMPVARIMQLYRKHIGKNFLDVTESPEGLDVTASRTGNKIYLHVANTSMSKSCTVKLNIPGLKITSGKVFEIVEEPFKAISEYEPDLFTNKEHDLPADSTWTFPAGSVAAVELTVKEA